MTLPNHFTSSSPQTLAGLLLSASVVLDYSTRKKKKEKIADHYWRKIEGTRESQGWEKGDFISDGAFREGLTERVTPERIPRKSEGAGQAGT